MDCDTFHLELPDLIYGELDPSRKTAGDAHLATCSACTELLSDLQTVRTAAPKHTPPALLNSRIKLAARDALLGGGDPAPPITGRGGPLHTATTLVLAACVCLAGFGLGIYYERQQQPGDVQARDPLPKDPEPPVNLVHQDQDPWLVEISDPNPDSKANRISLDPEAWQRVMHEVGTAHLQKGDYEKARVFFARAAAREGPLTAAAQVGVAEALLREGAHNAAKTKLEELRNAVRGGQLVGDEALLQRIHELIEEASGN